MAVGLLLLCFACIVAGGSSQSGDDDGAAAFKRLVSEYRSHVKKTLRLSWGSSRGRVAVGFNANLDLISRAKPLFDRLGQSRFHRTRAVDHVTLETLEDFVETLLLYSQLGKAAERFVTNSTLFSYLVDESGAIEGSRYAVGGNAALMAKNIAQEYGHAVDVLLGGIAREKLRDLLMQNDKKKNGESGQKRKSSLDDVLDVIGPSEVLEDQVHLILEYGAGEVFLKGLEWKAQRSNRFIVSSDVANSEMKAAAPFFKRLHTWQPDAVIVSGLHLLDGIAERPRRRDLLRQVRTLLLEAKKKLADHEGQKKKKGTVPFFHFEWASVGDVSLVGDIAQMIMPHVESVGMNEEELRTLYSALNGTHLAPNDFSHHPLVAHMEHALHHILTHPFFLSSSSSSSLRRLHFHSLGLHLIALRSDDDNDSVTTQWQQQDLAVAEAAIATSLRVCGEEAKKKFEEDGDDDDDDDVSKWFEARVSQRWTSDKPTPLSPGSSWRSPDGKVIFYAAPVLMCRQPLHTVGAGDSISSTALMMSLRPLLTQTKEKEEL